MNPTVAICIPSLNLVPAQFAHSLALLARGTTLPIWIISAHGSLLPIARDNCIDQVAKIEAQQNGRFDYIFFLDSDVIVPQETVMRLVAHGKDVVGAAYVRKSSRGLMVRSLDDQPLRATTGLVEVAGLPTGCLLIRRSIFDQLKKPYFRLRHDEALGVTFTEDYVFCEMARALGYSIWLDVDLSTEVGHLDEFLYRPISAQ